MPNSTVSKGCKARTDIVASLLFYAKERNTRFISPKEYAAWGKGPSVFAVYEAFGDWESAIKEAFLPPPHANHWTKYTDSDVFAALYRCTKLHKKKLSIEAYKKLRNPQEPSVSAIVGMFDTWHDALVLLGVQTMASYTKEDMIATLQLTASLFDGHIPLPLFRKQKCKPSAALILKQFGDWESAVQAAGLDSDLSHGDVAFTKQDVILAIQGFARHANRSSLRLSDYLKWNKGPSITTITRFFPNWEAAVIASGFLPLVQREYTDEEILTAIKRCAEANDGKISSETYLRMKTAEEPSISTINKHFGSWNKALTSASIPTRNFYSDEEILEALRLASSLYDGRLTKDAYTELGMKPAAISVIKRFGTWNQALQTAGITKENQRYSKSC